MDIDLAIDVNGNLILDENGDYKKVTGDELLLQRVMFRLKTVLGDYLVDKLLGTDIEDIIGQTNGPKVWSKVRSIVEREVGRVPNMREFSIYVAPLSEGSIAVGIEIAPGPQKKQLQLTFELDPRTGEVTLRI